MRTLTGLAVVVATLVGCSGESDEAIAGQITVSDECVSLDGTPIYSNLLGGILRRGSDVASLSTEWFVESGSDVEVIGRVLPFEEAQSAAGNLLDSECYAGAEDVLVVDEWKSGCEPICPPPRRSTP